LQQKLYIDTLVIGNNKYNWVIFSFGILQDSTFTRIYPWIKKYAKDTARFILPNFFNHIDQAFANLYEAQEAIEKLNAMKQGNRSFQDFIREFEETMLKTGSNTLPNKTRKGYLKATLNKS
jgi:hypothetical protein